MKFVLFSVSENEENGRSDEGADGAIPHNPSIFGLEPLLTKEETYRVVHVDRHLKFV